MILIITYMYETERYAAISRHHKIFSEIIERARRAKTYNHLSLRMALTLTRHIPDVENVRIVEIY